MPTLTPTLCTLTPDSPGVLKPLTITTLISLGAPPFLPPTLNPPPPPPPPPKPPKVETLSDKSLSNSEAVVSGITLKDSRSVVNVLHVNEIYG
ncbi:hypothetical protein BYT27DRAFT_7252952 [Phlegmacium glaucopus]|nr:hypothetical protein BYT27DRAFT_7252952 [Phlegmacium glaucopus]